MTRRLLDNVTNEFELELLQAGRCDRMPEESRAALFTYFNVTPEATPDVDAPQLPDASAPSAGAGDWGASLGLAKGLAGAISTGKGLVAAATLGALGAVGALTVSHVQSPPANEQPAPTQSVPRAPTPPPQIAPTAPATPPPRSASPNPSPTGAVPPAVAVAPPADTPTRLPATKPASPAGSLQTLTNELEAIEAARRALANRDAHRALRLLERYRRSHPAGRLRMEAEVLRIEALAARGDRASAARLARAFTERQPNSPYTRRIQSLLAQLDDGSTQ